MLILSDAFLSALRNAEQVFDVKCNNIILRIQPEDNSIIISSGKRTFHQILFVHTPLKLQIQDAFLKFHYINCCSPAAGIKLCIYVRQVSAHGPAAYHLP